MVGAVQLYVNKEEGISHILPLFLKMYWRIKSDGRDLRPSPPIWLGGRQRDRMGGIELAKREDVRNRANRN